MTLGGYVIHPIQALLDYPLAFAALGLAGFFKKHPFLGVTIAITGRFISSFLSGILFFTGFTLEGAIASAVYNGTYLVGEFVISIILMYIIIKRRLLDIYL
jgi:thiamine transporter